MWIGDKIYGPILPTVSRVGPRTIIELRLHVSEVEAMLYVAKHTIVPVPKFFAFKGSAFIQYLTMEYIEGLPAHLVWPRLTAKERITVLQDLQDCVRQLRALIPPSTNQISSISGGPCRDHRLGSWLWGPFDTIDEFHRLLCWNVNHSEMPEEVVALHSRSYTSVFTHGDLVARNVTVNKWRLAAIIDWNSAGWRPEYWEYTKSNFGGGGNPREWSDAIKAATGARRKDCMRSGISGSGDRFQLRWWSNTYLCLCQVSDSLWCLFLFRSLHGGMKYVQAE